MVKGTGVRSRSIRNPKQWTSLILLETIVVYPLDWDVNKCVFNLLLQNLEKSEILRPETFCAHSGPPYPFYYFQNLLRIQNILYCLEFIWECDIPMRSIGCPPGVNSNVILVSICLRTVHLLATLNGYTSNCDIQFTFSQIHMYIAWLFTAHYLKYTGVLSFRPLKNSDTFFMGFIVWS